MAIGIGLGNRLRRGGGVSVPANPVPELLWLKMNDGAGTAVTADVGPDATWSTSSYWGPGVAGGGGDFGGGSHDITTNSAINYGTDKITFCFWFKQDALANQYIAASPEAYTTTDKAWDVACFSNGKMRARVGSYIGGVQKSSQYLFDNPSAPMLTDTWQHVVITLDYNHTDGGGECRCFVDGVEYTDPDANRFKDPASAGDFGTYALTIGSIRNAEADDFRIYNRLITTDEMAAIRANPA